MSRDEAAVDRLHGAWFLGLARMAMGVMWFQQALWKLPWENYGGLRYWLKRASDAPLVGWYKAFLDNVVFPNFNLFGFQVWAGETVIALMLFFGLFGRLGGLLSGLMAVNLLIAMSAVPGEWYWTYMFIALLGFVFFYTRAGRYIGVDRLIAPAIERAAAQGKPVARWLRLLV